MPGPKNYDPQSVIVTFGTQQINGFMENSMIEVERDEDSFTHKANCDGGEGTRTRNANRAGKIKLKLQQTSESNAYLSACLAADELAPNGISILPLMIKDLSGHSMAFAKAAWVMKYPKASYDKDVTEREWTLQTGNLSIVEGGN